MNLNENEPFAYHLKDVVLAIQDAEGGWLVELACGHKIWCAVDPGQKMYCGACLDEFARRAFAFGRSGPVPVPPGTPYGSRDVGHVPPPDPEYFWPFTKGQHRVIAYQPPLTFEVTEIHDTWIAGILCLEHKRVNGELHMDMPVVAIRENGAPMITLTLRRVDSGQAYLQVTASPTMTVMERE